MCKTEILRCLSPCGWRLFCFRNQTHHCKRWYSESAGQSTTCLLSDPQQVNKHRTSTAYTKRHRTASCQWAGLHQWDGRALCDPMQGGTMPMFFQLRPETCPTRPICVWWEFPLQFKSFNISISSGWHWRTQEDMQNFRSILISCIRTLTWEFISRGDRIRLFESNGRPTTNNAKV